MVLPRQQLTDDSEILDFLLAHVGWFDMYIEDDYAAFVRYCFEDPLDAEIFRARFEPKIRKPDWHNHRPAAAEHEETLDLRY